MTPTKSERVLILKQIIHQSILEHCADLLDEENIIFNQLQLGISDPVNREESELHIRMADAAWNEYEKTMFNKSDQTQIEKLEADKAELLERRKGYVQILQIVLDNPANNLSKSTIDLIGTLIREFENTKK